MADYKASVYIMTAGSLLNLVIGIIGIANCNKIQRAGICFVCGIILIVWQLGTDAYSAVTSGITGMGIVSIIIGLILPLLYFWGLEKPSGNAGQQGPVTESENRRCVLKRKGQDETGDHIFCFALFFLVTLSVQVAKRSEWLNLQFCCVTFNWRTSSTPHSSALQNCKFSSF